MNAIHFSDAILTVIFCGCGTFALWSVRQFITMDKKLDTLALQLRIVIRNALPEMGDDGDNPPIMLKRRNRR